ncbi:MAG: NADH:ubiquinone oxidoreductase [Chloroflexi bacterium]|nr:NADH:ubiquinone oxidoreductase [Chloroflexota bacterium]
MMLKAQKAKPRVAFFDFTSCEGCQLTVIDALQYHPELLDVIDIVEFREASSDSSDEYDIAFIEGSCTRPSDERRLRLIRERADVVVALGACAHLGGINAIRNTQNLEDVRQYMYDGQAHWFETYAPRAISKVIEVDLIVPGCPINGAEFVWLVKGLLQGRMLEPLDYPLCIECKLKENVCVFQRGQICLGPITRAGCDAICPMYGVGCKGCRGLITNPNLEAFYAVLREHGLSPAEVETKLTLFLTNQTMSMSRKEVAHVEPAH